jgi:cephalosporin-C deacetylase-like acetyl esterase
MRRRVAKAAALVLAGAANLLFITPVLAADAPTSRAALIQALDAQANASLSARHAAVMAITTPAAMKARQAEVKAKILKLIGTPVHGQPLAARVTGRMLMDGFTVQNVVYDGAPGEHVTANLFVPDGKGPFPAIILSPGHGNSGKLSNYDFAANFARNGIVALAYDIVDEGERMENYDPVTGRSRGEKATGDHTLAAFPAIYGGEHVARYFLQDAMQGIDYLQSLPVVDPKRIGAFGCSGGGTITAYLAALDDRVQAAGAACYVNDFNHILASVGPQDAEQSIPGFISGGLDIPDWVELTAPKPFAVISTTEDMFPFAGATAAVDEARHVWGVMGAPDKLVWLTGPGPHGAIQPMGDKIVGFFRQSLGVSGTAVPFAPLKPPRDDILMATPTGQLVTSGGTVTYADLEREHAASVAPAKAPDAAAVRAAIVRLAGVTAKPGAAPVVETVSDTVVRFPSDLGPIEARVIKAATTTKVVLLLDATPLDQLTGPRGRATVWAKAGFTVVALQARGADGTEESKAALAGDENLLSLRAMMNGRTLPGMRIDDAIRAVDWIAATFPGAPVAVSGSGIMGPVALQVAALDDRVKVARTEGSVVSWKAALDRPIARDLPANAIPGVLTAYDLPDVVAAIGPRLVEMAAPVDPVGVPLREADVFKWVARGKAIYSPRLDLQ